MNIDNWITAVLALRKAKRVVVFTGAGVSAESGIPTFRDSDGFWQRFPIEQFANWNGLLKTAISDPRSVAEFILNVVEPIAKAEPNAGHSALARLQERVKTVVVTQNVDGLHQSAGSKEVHEIHGSLMEVVDVSTRSVIKRFNRSELAEIADLLKSYVVSQRSLVSLLWHFRKRYPIDWLGRHRPNLVLFGDELAEPAWTNAGRAVDSCDVMIAVGTSGVVYPAAMLPGRAANAGATVITIDPQPNGECWLEGRSEIVLPKLIQDAFG